jgi:hypothetical protein
MLVLTCEHPKAKKTINGDLLLKPFKNKILFYLSTITKNKHEVNITQNIFFLMIFFQKTKNNISFQEKNHNSTKFRRQNFC